MKITSVEPQKKSLRQSSGRVPKRFNIFLDGQFAFGADEDLVVEKRLVVGKEIQSEDLEKLLFESEVGKLMERMYRLFGIRQRSEKEVRQKLSIINFQLSIKDKEQYSDLSLESLINKLKQKNMINDLEFAKAWVEARSKKRGRVAIKAELIKKGIDRDIIEEVLNSEFKIQNEENVAAEILERKIRSWRSLPEMEFKKKATEFLMRKGFAYSVARKVVENMTKKEV